jgi:hypothetical protein
MFAYTTDCCFTNARDGKMAKVWADRGIWIDAYGNKRAIDGDGSAGHIANFLKQTHAYTPLFRVVADGHVLAICGSLIDAHNIIASNPPECDDYLAILSEGRVKWWSDFHPFMPPPDVVADIEQNYPAHEHPWAEDRDGIARTTELPRGWYIRSWVGVSSSGDYHHHAVLSHHDATIVMTVASEFHPERQYLMTAAAYLHENAEELFRQAFWGFGNDITF